MKRTKIYMTAIAAIAAFVATVSAISTVSAQSGDASSEIAIMAITPSEADGFPAGAIPALKNKMSQMAAASGFGSMNHFAQFCMMVTVDVESKDVVAGAPPKYSETLNFNFYIVDQFDQKVFATTTIRAKGIGNSEDKAFVQAINGINARSTDLAAFVSAGRDKIIDYYNDNCTKIIAKAYSLSQLEQYEEALFFLSQIPAASDCYLHSIAATTEIYNLYQDRMCSENLARAKAVWSASQNAEGGLAAGVFLARISPEGRCFPDAEDLFEEIKREVKDDKEFAKNFMIKQWDDTVTLESQTIEAARQVGISWGDHQQPITTNPAWIVE
jgi:hypothetical protein